MAASPHIYLCLLPCVHCNHFHLLMVGTTKTVRLAISNVASKFSALNNDTRERGRLRKSVNTPVRWRIVKDDDHTTGKPVRKKSTMVTLFFMPCLPYSLPDDVVSASWRLAPAVSSIILFSFLSLQL